MALISERGSEYQIASVSLDGGYRGELILMLIEVHVVIEQL